RVANARVEALDSGPNKSSPIRLRFVIQPQVQISEVRFDISPPNGTPISEDELRASLALIQPGARFSRQVLSRIADEILVYMRDRGYFNATVEPVEQLDASGTRASVDFHITPGEQARVASFNINIQGFDPSAVIPLLKLQREAPFSRD